MDLEKHSKDVGLHIVNRTDWAINLIPTPHGTNIPKQHDFC